MTEKISITDLPLDILVLVFPYLDAKSFLSLCSTCKAFQQPSIRLDPAYWSFATRSAFRVPNQPVVQHDGERWQKMYRRMLTQSRAFTWGNNSHSRLGHSYGDGLGQPLMTRFRRPGRRAAANGLYVSFPTEMENTRSIGIIADLQCGGWSTTLLSARGTLYIAGILDGEIMFSADERLQPLKFPPGYPAFSENAQYEEPTIAIRQFSAGRSHVLGLSDSGRIWSWYDVKRAALHIKFPNIELKETKTFSSSVASSLHGQVRQVVAGWSISSAYVYGVGIVLWSPVARDDEDDSMDTMLVLHSIEVPKTAYMRSRDKGGESEEQRLLGEEVGVVLNYVMLEHFVVLVTDIGKVFCGRLGEGNKIEDILELRALRSETGKPSDVQGSFRRFAIFKNGEVITSDQDYLEAVWARGQDDFDQNEMAGLHRIPALQHNDVISVAFGDFHYLALHSDGRITSYGKEMGACGALGLGGEEDSEGRARGVVYERFGRDGRLLPHAATKGRQVWFDNRKKDWLHHIMQGGQSPEESENRRALFENDESVAGEVSEWIEQEARAWDKGQVGEDDLGAYFALRVSAAGWHSAAVVLVNEDLANSDGSGFSTELTFPRLKLADGTEMSGTGSFDEWREGRPEWTFDDGT